ncbi:hypothetical protein GCM10017706_24010 [Lactococcus lactis subsp. hordniae]
MISLIHAVVIKWLKKEKNSSRELFFIFVSEINYLERRALSISPVDLTPSTEKLSALIPVLIFSNCLIVLSN